MSTNPLDQLDQVAVTLERAAERSAFGNPIPSLVAADAAASIRSAATQLSRSPAEHAGLVEIVCPRCDHDHGTRWRDDGPFAGCTVLLGQSVKPPKYCGCQVPLSTALQYQAILLGIGALGASIGAYLSPGRQPDDSHALPIDLALAQGFDREEHE